MHRSFQKNKFHHHTIHILENRRLGTGGETYGSPPPRSSATILDQEVGRFKRVQALKPKKHIKDPFFATFDVS